MTPEEDEEFWSPDKLAVLLARKLNSERDSPLAERIIVAAENDFILSRAEARQQGRWMVSMATVVQGISRLISSNPKRDAALFNPAIENGGTIYENLPNQILRHCETCILMEMTSLYT